MSYLKIEDLLNENEDYIEYKNKKYLLDTSMQVLIKYNNILEKYLNDLEITKGEKEQEKLLENFGIKISEILFINKNDLIFLQEELKTLTPKKQDLVWKNIFKIWLNAMSIDTSKEEKNQKKKDSLLI